jgi:hypothetical protein
MKQFYNSKGELTAYGLACGYIEKYEALQQSLTLWREGGIYHVRRHNHFHNKRVFWVSFEKLTDARKTYNQHAKEIKSLCYIPA